MGFRVCDTDTVAHRLMGKGSLVYARLLDCFGEEMLSKNGEIDRSVLGRIVFRDSELRGRLNAIVHPAVRNFLADWIVEQRTFGQPAAAEIPLLFESGMDGLDWDAVMCISSREDLVVERLAARGMDRAQALERIYAQMALAEKERRSSCVVANNGSLNEFEDAIRSAVHMIMG